MSITLGERELKSLISINVNWCTFLRIKIQKKWFRAMPNSLGYFRGVLYCHWFDKYRQK